MENNLREVYIYMEFKVISLKTTTLHSGVVKKNKFIIMKNGYKKNGWIFIYIHIYIKYNKFFGV